MSDVRMVQEMQGHEGVIWIMKFSPDGEYLATGGKDASILLWVVVSKRCEKHLYSLADLRV